MKLSDAAAEVIQLADCVREYWDAELPKRHADYPFIKAGESSGSPPPEASQLREFLLSLDEDLIYRLILLMYVGRGDFDTHDLEAYLEQMRRTFLKPEHAVSQMLQKPPLGDYLTDGLDILRKDGIDADHLLAQPARP